MAYATQDDLVPLRMTEKDLTELTDDDFSGEINAEIVTGALERASGIVDSYCRGRYATPLQTSDQVVGLTLDIAVYLLFGRRRTQSVTETVQKNYDQAMQFLRDVSTLKASLDQPSGAAPQTSLAGPSISEKDRHLVFNERNLEGFV